jgi:pyridoxine 5-phosphate synthase
MIRLGVNIDHVATVRQARRGREPDPVWAAVEAQLGGADGITLHVREDRRHIQDRDARLIRPICRVKYNLELAATDAMTALALELKPDQATFVPERREEVTTEGGLDVRGRRAEVEGHVQALKRAGVEVSMFIDPDPAQVEASLAVGADSVELHTGRYADATTPAEVARELAALVAAGRRARELNLSLNLGHGLTEANVPAVLAIPGVAELNIGHSIISKAMFIGLREAVRSMKRVMETHERGAEPVV